MKQEGRSILRNKIRDMFIDTLTVCLLIFYFCLFFFFPADFDLTFKI